ncbi:helix-turn-helix domain-containing protein [Terriglobus albidus]|uniref:helix-turn-helix domain-containing protein n=1 Tax=Terriglobus albidus TaxID=1592106 RepID=UPI0021DF49A9|nr:helix-turn-helix transcriptional regulator [Terriglobus albidus]
MTSSPKRDRLTLEKAFGRVLADLRENKGLKQIDVSVGTGYVERTVGIIERGEKSPTLRTMENFASFYGVPLEDLIARAKQLLRYEREGDDNP